jgi:hypothetical protein
MIHRVSVSDTNNWLQRYRQGKHASETHNNHFRHGPTSRTVRHGAVSLVAQAADEFLRLFTKFYWLRKDAAFSRKLIEVEECTRCQKVSKRDRCRCHCPRLSRSCMCMPKYGPGTSTGVLNKVLRAPPTSTPALSGPTSYGLRCKFMVCVIQ